MAKPEDFARKGEVFLTTVRIRLTEGDTPGAVERRFRRTWRGYRLRFDYVHVIYDGEVVGSIKWGELVSLRQGTMLGVAVYRRPKTRGGKAL